jgi:hypothetical protein
MQPPQVTAAQLGESMRRMAEAKKRANRPKPKRGEKTSITGSSTLTFEVPDQNYCVTSTCNTENWPTADHAGFNLWGIYGTEAEATACAIVLKDYFEKIGAAIDLAVSPTRKWFLLAKNRNSSQEERVAKINALKKARSDLLDEEDEELERAAAGKERKEVPAEIYEEQERRVALEDKELKIVAQLLNEKRLHETYVSILLSVVNERRPDVAKAVAAGTEKMTLEEIAEVNRRVNARECFVEWKKARKRAAVTEAVLKSNVVAVANILKDFYEKNTNFSASGEAKEILKACFSRDDESETIELGDVEAAKALLAKKRNAKNADELWERHDFPPEVKLGMPNTKFVAISILEDAEEPAVCVLAGFPDRRTCKEYIEFPATDAIVETDVVGVTMPGWIFPHLIAEDSDERWMLPTTKRDSEHNNVFTAQQMQIARVREHRETYKKIGMLPETTNVAAPVVKSKFGMKTAKKQSKEEQSVAIEALFPPETAGTSVPAEEPRAGAGEPSNSDVGREERRRKRRQMRAEAERGFVMPPSMDLMPDLDTPQRIKPRPRDREVPEQSESTAEFIVPEPDRIPSDDSDFDTHSDEDESAPLVTCPEARTELKEDSEFEEPVWRVV